MLVWLKDTNQSHGVLGRPERSECVFYFGWVMPVIGICSDLASTHASRAEPFHAAVKSAETSDGVCGRVPFGPELMG